MRTERRRAPRMKVNGLAYVNLDPDNGGIILDISEGGLCFQSTAPVKRTETIRFWFSYRGLRVESGQGAAGDTVAQTSGVSRLIEVRSELAWTDDTFRRGGLRFTNLSDKAREQIRDWIRQPALVHVNGGATRLFPVVRQSSTHLARVASAGFDILVQRMQSTRLWKGFSGGLTTGILASALLVATVSLLTHGHLLGDSLVQLGLRLGGKSWSQPISPGAQASSLETQSASAASQFTSLKSTAPPGDPDPDLEPRVPPRPAQSEPPEKLASPATAPPTAAKPPAVKLEATNPGAPSLSAPRTPVSVTPAANSAVDRPPVPGIGFTAAPDFGANVSRAPAPEMTLANRPEMRVEPSKVESVVLRSERYLEIGKFKDKLLADQATSRLSRLGFTATVIERSRLFGKSYQVLVGPYASDPEAETVHKDLSSHGFTPRSYERGKRNFYMPSGLQVASTRLPGGFCEISWESYAPDAIVRFDNNRDSNATVQGKWLKQPVRFTQDAVGYQRNRDGSRTLVEIRFSGMTQALVFASGSSK